MQSMIASLVKQTSLDIMCATVNTLTDLVNTLLMLLTSPAH